MVICGATLSGWGTVAVLSALVLPTCGRHEVAVEFYYASGHHFSRAERSAIQAVADDTATEVRALLPALSRGLTLRVYAGFEVIPETGETGTAIPPATVMWTVDPRRPGGVLETVRTQLRSSLFHEFHHLVRYRAVRRGGALMDEVVSEGMATAFERDFAGATPPWGAYSAQAGAWVQELIALPPDAPRDRWLVEHPDGRRWIGIRAGTYLVDQAAVRTGRSSASLVGMPTRDVMAMAGTHDTHTTPSSTSPPPFGRP